MMLEPNITLTLARSLSQNQLQAMREGVTRTGKRFGHANYRKYRDQLCWTIRQQVLEAGVKPRWPKIEPGQRRRGEGEKTTAILTRYSTGVLDTANAIGGCKPVWDALVLEGLIFDDSPKWFEAEYRQEKCKRGQGRTLVELWW